MIERVLGEKFPISIGTALVFECEDFNIDNWPNLLYVNLRTLYRNYVGSYPKDSYHQIKVDDFITKFFDEVANFIQIVSDLSRGRIRVFTFYPLYKDLKKNFPKVTVKQYNPDSFDEIEENMWEHVEKHGIFTPFEYTIITSGMEGSQETTMILTSFIIDLTYSNLFPTLLLLESHTGRIKKRQEWYTKLYVGGKYDRELKVPFCKFTIQIFGDRSGFLKGADRFLRATVRLLAMNDRWTPVTTKDKIKYSISKLKDNSLRDKLYSYL